MITTKIFIKPHLAEYLYEKYRVEGENYIKIPHSDDLYHIVFDLLRRKSENSEDFPQETNLELALPNRSVGKNPQYFNYLSARAQKIIEEKVDRIFKAEMHHYIDEMTVDFGMSYVDASYMFREKLNLHSITEDALIKDYYRYRRKIGRKKKRKQKYTKND